MKRSYKKNIPGRQEQMICIEPVPSVNNDKLMKDFWYNGGKEAVAPLINKTEDPEYLYWDNLQYKDWLPSQYYSPLEFWQIIKFGRKARCLPSPIYDQNFLNFTWVKTNKIEKLLHKLDLCLGGLEPTDEAFKNNQSQYLIRGLFEEAISSSQLEGAHTTRKVALDMLRQQRKPSNYAEQMIENNFKLINAIQADYTKEKLSLSLIKQMHRLVTAKTLNNPDEEGQLRKDDDIVVAPYPDDQNLISHIPPSVDLLEPQLTKLIDFANDKMKEEIFIHPIIKAIMIHFWIGYLHPFSDGNGRLARALFYWYLLRHNYHLIAYIPISERIKKSPTKYADAYIYSEQDDNDLTYFIDYHLTIITDSLEDFKKYLEKQNKEEKQLKALMISEHNFNRREIQLLNYLHKNKDSFTTVTSHINIYGVSPATAVKDLQNLLNKGFLENKKQGRYVLYTATQKVAELFK